ncbi:acetoin utilization protein AcuC, partial [bacterium]|nr:acetoin utilization protein AcuC [bacterium]
RGHLDADALFMGLGTADCPIFTGLYDYASLAAGATLLAADLILAGDARVAFNPSGGYHHAFPARAGGFCYINDVVLGCLRLADAGKRVLFLDVDVHHCDGVQHAFYSRADVMTLSLHESGATLFPGTGSVDEIGTGDGTGYSVNVPLPADTYDAAYLRAFDAVAMPVIRAFAPDVIVLELGMDALAGDPLAHLKLTNNAYADVVARVMSFGTPILATGGGGYHAENTARGWALAWRVFCGEEEDDDHATLGLGGVMLESAEWRGGLRDRVLAPDARECEAVDAAIDEAVSAVKAEVFPLHGLATLSDTPGV